MHCVLGEATFKIGNQTGYCSEIDLWNPAQDTTQSADVKAGWKNVQPWTPEMIEELAIASGMTDPGGPFPDPEMRARHQHQLFLDEFVECLDPEIVAELEWDECCEPSYFTVYDQTGHEGVIGERMVVNAVGEPILHDAQRHAQECALNEVSNRLAWPRDSVYTIENRDEFSVGNVECTVVATGEKFSVATSSFGAAFIPKSCGGHIPEIGETFNATLDTTFGKMREGGAKYPLRVRAGSIYYQ